MFQLAMKMLQVSINSLNRLYAEVEKVPTYCEGCFGLPTAHITAVVDFTINSQQIVRRGGEGPHLLARAASA